MSEKQQKLVLAIIDFLNHSIEDGTVKQDDREGLEVAVQCIGEAFGVDPSDNKQREQLSIKPANLMTLFELFLKTRDRMGAGSASAGPSSAPPPAKTVPSTPKVSSEADKAEAEKLKTTGNQLMSSKEYDGAIGAYTQAITKDPTNAVYYSNRAAAYSSKNDHNSAIADAEKAIEVNPQFTKAYHRLGHAYYSLGDYSSAVSAFKKGLEIDPTNSSLKTGLQNAESRVDTQAASPLTTSPPTAGAGPAGLGGLADMLGGMGGGGGGMPDIASLMQNPMLMQMAQQMMANGGIDQLMQNPSVANMMNRAQSGGGMPSMDEIMADPSLRDIASKFMGGAGRGGGGPPPGA